MKGISEFGSAKGAAWIPPAEYVARSRLAKAMKGWEHDTLSDLQRAAIDNPDWFWAAAADNLGINFTRPWETIRDDSAGKEFPRWFVRGELNASWHCVDRHAENPDLADKSAIVYEGDQGQTRTYTYRQLRDEVVRVARGLADHGVVKGDRIGIFAPVSPEAIATILAVGRLGAIAVPAFSGYGPEPLAARLNACEAKILVTVDATSRRGKVVPMKDIADQARALAPSVEKLVMIRHSGVDAPFDTANDIEWAELGTADNRPVPPVAMEANDPLLIIFTSGTTGAPKGIVHSHLGYLLKPAIDFGYAFDIQSDDTVAWIADLGWMLGPLMTYGILQFGATAVFIEGLPDYPIENRLWDIVERHKATLLGLAPTAARGLKNGAPTENISSLRAFISTGEAWDTPTWQWLFETVGEKRLPILNYTGGTETGGGLLSCYTIAPQSPGSFSGPLLGQDIDVLTPDGARAEGIGELCVHNSWPGMTHGFWNNNERYKNTYWTQLPGTWLHGDLCSVDAQGFWHIHGRSDDTIKVSGRRIGPAEIESALVTHPQITEAAVIGVPDQDRGQRIVAFVTLTKDAAALDEADASACVIKAVGKAMAPSALIAVPGLPKTKNGKIMRRAIRARYLGEPAGDMSALDAATPLDLIPVMA
ncbi:AMP-binding protein [Brucella haematophila]|uniref:AMP-binding protein n=1 Tax=Brucella haematophila TaxID=419474 RepID=UPI00110DAA8C|nr:AMP-binding protein [Brucella haematophila]TMV04527.1 AMP-binding protein [Brucella haematophila]